MEEPHSYSGSWKGVYDCGLQKQTVPLYYVGICGGDRKDDGAPGKSVLESGNLSTNLFVRLERGLDEAEDMKQCSLKEVNEWWRNIQEDFKRLNQNYQDYLRDFYSGRTDHLLKSVEFIVHKDKFIKYLHEFVQELQNHGKKDQPDPGKASGGNRGCSA